MANEGFSKKMELAIAQIPTGRREVVGDAKKQNASNEICAQLTVEKAKAIKEVAAAHKSIEKLTNNLTKASKDLDARSIDLDAAVSKLEKSGKSLSFVKSELGASKKKVDELTEQVKELSEKAEQETEGSKLSQKDARALRAAGTKDRLAATKAATRVTNLEQQVDESRSRLQTIQQESKGKKYEIAQLTKEREQARLEIAELKASRDATERANQELTVQGEQTQTNLQTAWDEASVERHKTKLAYEAYDRLYDEVERWKSNSRHWEQRTADSYAKFNELQDEVERAQKTTTEAYANFAVAESAKQMAWYDRQITESNQLLTQQHKDEVATLTTAWKAKRSEKRGKLKAVKAKVVALDLTLLERQDEAVRLHAQITKLEATANSQITALKQQQAEAVRVQETLKTDKKALKKKVADLRKQCQEVEVSVRTPITPATSATSSRRGGRSPMSPIRMPSLDKEGDEHAETVNRLSHHRT